MFATNINMKNKGSSNRPLPAPHTGIGNAGGQNLRKNRGLSNLYNDFAPGTTGQDPVVCAEHVVKLMHRIYGWLDLAYGEYVWVRGQPVLRVWVAYHPLSSARYQPATLE